MTTKKIFGALGPVALAASVGMGAFVPVVAQALMIDGQITGVTYAKETLRLDLTSSAVGDGTKYYDIMRSHTLGAPAQVRKTELHDAERYTVLFELTGMVFAASLPSSSTADTGLQRTDDVDPPSPAPATEDGDAVFTLYAGGSKGDNYVAYQVAENAQTVEVTDVLTLRARFAVSEDGGGIKRTVLNANLSDSGLPETAWKRVHQISSAVAVKSALMETVIPVNQEAKAMHDFMAFGGTLEVPDLTASLGSVMFGVVTTPLPLRNAQSGAARTDDLGTTEVDESLTDISGVMVNVRMLSDIIAPKSTPTVNPVSFSGDVSFVSKVALVDSEACGGLKGATDLRVPSVDDPKVLTDTLMATDANDFASAKHLCLMVDGETEIPVESYSVETKYAPVSSSHAFAAPGATHPFGTISRDGTTVHIPFLTTYENYNQRLLLRNRSGREVTYTVTFVTEDGTVATPSKIDGTLPMMSVEMLRVGDLVTLSGDSNRTAATVISNAAGGTLGVATTLVNKLDRSTDTETYAQ